jgi:hypothetical protein
MPRSTSHSWTQKTAAPEEAWVNPRLGIGALRLELRARGETSVSIDAEAIPVVIPAKAGTQGLGSRVRGNDNRGIVNASYDSLIPAVVRSKSTDLRSVSKRIDVPGIEASV